ncbi:MAG: right-handed parallel beta-helix repeat-containing protein, partial [Chloroflexi bacterium]|nr:right-handed parallel beta-helix repeat-containing protein [Chloroflexota bacterium]
FTAAVSNTSGYWDFVQIGGGSVLTDSDSSQISYALLEGGGYPTYNPTLHIYRSSPTLDHITIRNSGGEGLNAYYYYNDQKGFRLDTAVIENNGEQGMYLYYGGHYTFTNVTIQNNAGDGIYAQYIGDLTLTNSTLTNNTGYGYFDYNSNNSLALQNVNLTNNGVAGRLPVNTAMNNVDWTGNTRNEIEWSGGTLTQPADWVRLPAGITTYHVVGDISVADGVSLTVGAGVNVIFSQYAGLFVNGQITAVGTPTNPITFTAAVSNTSGYWDFVQIGGGS